MYSLHGTWYHGAMGRFRDGSDVPLPGDLVTEENGDKLVLVSTRYKYNGTSTHFTVHSPPVLILSVSKELNPRQGETVEVLMLARNYLCKGDMTWWVSSSRP